MNRQLLKLETPFNTALRTRAGRKGQGLTEYLILLSLVAIVSIAVISEFGSVIRERIEKAKNKIVHYINI